MKLDEARALRDALNTAIADAEASGSTEANLQGALDASLGAAIDELQTAIDNAAKPSGG